MTHITLRAYVNLDIDLTALFHRISRHAKVHLGGEDGFYIVEYSGCSETGYLVMDELLKMGGCKIFVMPTTERR